MSRASEQLRHLGTEQQNIAQKALCGELADLLEECERAFEFIQQDDCGCDECNIAREMLAKLREQEKASG